MAALPGHANTTSCTVPDIVDRITDAQAIGADTDSMTCLPDEYRITR